MEIPRKKPKRLLYLKAVFPEEDNRKTLELYLREAYSVLPLVKDRQVEFKGKTWWGTFYDGSKENSFGFQISASTPGDAATLVPTGDLNVATIELDKKTPPSGFEFSDGDAICCVSDNHVFACLSNLRDTAIGSYLRKIFERAGAEKNACNVQIEKPADFNKIALIHRAGIKCIILNASLSGAEFSRLDDIKGKNILRKIVRGLFNEDERLVANAKKSGSRLQVKLTGGKYPEKWLMDEAENTLEGSDTYKIETRDGKIITPQMITISKKTSIETWGKSVFLNEALIKLEEFKNDILGSGSS